jgi:hypothetical protein
MVLSTFQVPCDWRHGHHSCHATQAHVQDSQRDHKGLRQQTGIHPHYSAAVRAIVPRAATTIDIASIW